MDNGKGACVMAVPNPNFIQQFLIESDAEMRFCFKRFEMLRWRHLDIRNHMVLLKYEHSDKADKITFTNNIKYWSHNRGNLIKL